MFANVTVFYSLANIDSLPYNKSELPCRITRANIADMFAVTFVSGVIERTLHQQTWANIRCRIKRANISELRCRITRANIADMFAVLFVSGVSVSVNKFASAHQRTFAGE